MNGRTLVLTASLLALCYLPWSAGSGSLVQTLSVANAAGQGDEYSGKSEKAEKADKIERVKLPGNLNAAHASATAREHANPNSQVGKIARFEALASYEECIKDAAAVDCEGYLDGFVDLDQTSIDDVPSSGSVLIDASNKPIDDGEGNVLAEVRDAIYRLLGITAVTIEPAPVDEAVVE